MILFRSVIGKHCIVACTVATTEVCLVSKHRDCYSYIVLRCYKIPMNCLIQFGNKIHDMINCYETNPDACCYDKNVVRSVCLFLAAIKVSLCFCSFMKLSIDSVSSDIAAVIIDHLSQCLKVSIDKIDTKPNNPFCMTVT